MQQFVFLFFIVLLLDRPVNYAAYLQGTPAPEAALEAPLPGQALQGSVPILGSTAVEGFQSAQLEFTYADHPLPTWFLIWQSSEAAAAGLLAYWDTMAITDGVYDLRLTVFLTDGSRQVVSVEDLRVRNYTPVETDTPAPTLPAATPQPVETLLPSATATPAPADALLPPADVNLPPADALLPHDATLPAPASTRLPPNPAQVSFQQVWSSLGIGALAAAGLFALGGLYWIVFIRKNR